MNHVSPTEEPRIALRASSSDTPGPTPLAVVRNTHEAPLTAHACGRTVYERVITPTERLAEFDWMI